MTRFSTSFHRSASFWFGLTHPPFSTICLTRRCAKSLSIQSTMGRLLCNPAWQAAMTALSSALRMVWVHPVTIPLARGQYLLLSRFPSARPHVASLLHGHCGLWHAPSVNRWRTEGKCGGHCMSSQVGWRATQRLRNLYRLGGSGIQPCDLRYGSRRGCQSGLHEQVCMRQSVGISNVGVPGYQVGHSTSSLVNPFSPEQGACLLRKRIH